MSRATWKEDGCVKDGGQGPGRQSCLLQIEQGVCVTFAIPGSSSSSGVFGRPQVLALQIYVLAVLKLLLTGMSPIIAPGKPIRLADPACGIRGLLMVEVQAGAESWFSPHDVDWLIAILNP